MGKEGQSKHKDTKGLYKPSHTLRGVRQRGLEEIEKGRIVLADGFLKLPKGDANKNTTQDLR